MSDFWSIVVSNAVVASVLAVVAGLLDRVWRNPAALHLLWVVVLLKLGTPPLFTAPLPRVENLAPRAEIRHSPLLPDPRPTDPSLAANLPTDATAWPPQPSRRDPVSVIARARPWSLETLLGTLWLLGSGGMIWVQARRIRRFVVGLRDCQPAPPELRVRVADLARRLGLRRVPEVALTPHAWPPLVWSIGTAPRLVLPAALFARLSEPAQTTILAHELIHIRRGDHLVRLLELASLTVFWWHPVVWVARRRLRDLEEACCDGRVVELLPDQPRTYATALLATLEFLAGRLGPPVPLRTAILSSPSLSRRILMLTRPRPNRINTRTGSLVVALAALPLALAFAHAHTPEPRPEPAPEVPPVREVQQPAATPVAVLRGRVTDKADAPLAGVRVIVAVPATDMHYVDTTLGQPPRFDRSKPGTGIDPDFLETTSDASGDYRLELPGLTKPLEFSFDARKPGYRRLVGMLMMRGDAKSVTVGPGQTVDANLALEPALYCRGVVVDEQGKPLPAVEISANMRMGRGSGGVERTLSRPDGSFELFNYPIKPFKTKDQEGESAGYVRFSHPDYVESKIDDIYALDQTQRESLRVVLPTGQQVTGTVVDAAGQPVPEAMIEIVGKNRKAILTDADGHFALRGLSGGPATLNARSLPSKQKANLPLTLDTDQNNMEVRLQPMVLPANLKSYDVLGMKLTDVTPEVKAAYDLYYNAGALILDPGPNSDQLKIGKLAEGYTFWHVGETNVGTVRAFVNQILTEAAATKAGEDASVRVVYGFTRPEFTGTNTQYLKLMPADRQRLQALAEQMQADQP